MMYVRYSIASFALLEDVAKMALMLSTSYTACFQSEKFVRTQPVSSWPSFPMATTLLEALGMAMFEERLLGLAAKAT